MCTEQQLALVMRQVVEAAKAAFGASVRQVILFGSYARGAAEEDSDVDVMILLDLPREQLPAHRRAAATTIRISAAPIGSQYLRKNCMAPLPLRRQRRQRSFSTSSRYSDISPHRGQTATLGLPTLPPKSLFSSLASTRP